MDLEYVGRVLARLKPFIREGIIRRTRIQRVLGTLHVPAHEVLPEIERLLAKAGVTIEEDSPRVESAVASPTGAIDDAQASDGGAPQDQALVDVDEAVRAARHRLELDRSITNHAKVLLRPEEEVGLATLVRGGSGKPLGRGDFARLTGEPRKAAECLLLHNQGLVHSVAKRYAPPGMTYEDVFQHGVVGLIRAVELFDPLLGNKFSTYATTWIRQSITRGIANEARLIRLPVHMLERVQKVWATRSRLTVDGEEPGVHQLALVCELTDEQVRECLKLGPQHVTSLDTPVGPEGEATLADLLDVTDPDLDPEHLVELKLFYEQLRSVLDTLNVRDAGVVSMRFGLIDGEGMTLDEIGKIYGVTRERIRQIEHRAISRLQEPSRSHVLRPYRYWDYDAR